MIERDQGEGAEGPEDKGMGEARQAGAARMTLAWKRTSQTKSRMRLPMGKRWKLGSFFDLRILPSTAAKRRPKMKAEAAASAAKSSFSAREKCSGSAKVASSSVISEPTTIHY